MVAVYVRNGVRAAEELQALGGIPDGALVFAEDAAEPALPALDTPGSLYWAAPPRSFERVVVSPALRLFVSPWSRALFAQWERSLVPGGTLLLPFAGDGSSDGFWTAAALRQEFGREGLERDRWLELERRDVPPEVPSVLAWYFRGNGALTLDHLTLAGRDWSELERLVATLAGDLVVDRRPTRAGRTDPPDLAAAFDSVRYWMGGLGYKEPVLAYILGTRLGGRAGLRIADVGGGPGWIAAELLLDPAVDVARAVNVDVSPAYAVLAWHLYRALGEQLEDRFVFVRSSMEDHEYDAPLDAVSFVGSLLYVDRRRRRDVLARAWDALADGGVLVVHENIRAPSYTRDFELMFTADELDSLLGSFGRVEHVSSTSASEVKKSDVGDRTVFRVVRKRSRRFSLPWRRPG